MTLDDTFKDFDTGDKRSEFRLWGRVGLKVERIAADPLHGVAPEIDECRTMDVSANGIRAWAPNPLPKGAILHLIVSIGGCERDFHLVGEVRWVRPSETGEGQVVGFEIHASEETSILEWKEAVADLIA